MARRRQEGNGTKWKEMEAIDALRKIWHVETFQALSFYSASNAGDGLLRGAVYEEHAHRPCLEYDMAFGLTANAAWRREVLAFSPIGENFRRRARTSQNSEA